MIYFVVEWVMIEQVVGFFYDQSIWLLIVVRSESTIGFDIPVLDAQADT